MRNFASIKKAILHGQILQQNTIEEQEFIYIEKKTKQKRVILGAKKRAV